MQINVTLGDGSTRTIAAQEGLSVMEVLRNAGILDGECNGSLACATCHVWVDESWLDKLETPLEGEEDMLDVAFNIAPTSRLCCQIIMGPGNDGIRISLPHPL